MRRRSVSGNTSPNAGFLLVRAESGSSTEVSPRFHYAQAQCFQAFFENTVQCGIWHPGASRQGGANEAYLSRCFSAPPPNFNVVDSGVWQLQKDHVFEIPDVIIEIGG